jgi:hypothetical protein
LSELRAKIFGGKVAVLKSLTHAVLVVLCVRCCSEQRV